MRMSASLAKQFSISRRAAKEFIKEGKAFVDGSCVKKDIEVDGSEKLSLDINFERPDGELSDYLLKDAGGALFFYKPPFMHTEIIRPDDPLTLQDVVNQHYPKHKLLSRLDFQADGVVGAYLTDEPLPDVSKKYLACVRGIFPDYAELNLAIDASHRKRVRVLGIEGNHPTFFRLKETVGKYSIVEAELVKAARHQVRSYLAYLGFPILGDGIYGQKNFERLMLHCTEYEINDEKCVSGKDGAFLDYFYESIKI